MMLSTDPRICSEHHCSSLPSCSELQCALSVLDLGQREHIVVHYSPVVNYNDALWEILGSVDSIIVVHPSSSYYCELPDLILDLGQREHIVVHYSPVVNYNALSLS